MAFPWAPCGRSVTGHLLFGWSFSYLVLGWPHSHICLPCQTYPSELSLLKVLDRSHGVVSAPGLGVGSAGLNVTFSEACRMTSMSHPSYGFSFLSCGMSTAGHLHCPFTGDAEVTVAPETVSCEVTWSGGLLQPLWARITGTVNKGGGHHWPLHPSLKQLEEHSWASHLLELITAFLSAACKWGFISWLLLHAVT